MLVCCDYKGYSQTTITLVVSLQICFTNLSHSKFLQKFGVDRGSKGLFDKEAGIHGEGDEHREDGGH